MSVYRSRGAAGQMARERHLLWRTSFVRTISATAAGSMATVAPGSAGQDLIHHLVGGARTKVDLPRIQQW